MMVGAGKCVCLNVCQCFNGGCYVLCQVFSLRSYMLYIYFQATVASLSYNRKLKHILIIIRLEEVIFVHIT